MRLTISLIALLCFITLAGCLQKKSKPERIWFYVDGQQLSSDYDDISPTSFINLEADGTYTSYLEQFDYGKWRVNEKALFLLSHSGMNIAYEIKYPSANEMQLQTPDKSILSFEGRISGSKTETNPFSLPMNRWRITAKASENEQQIRERLHNHFLFQEQYFRWAQENDIKSIDVRSTPSLLKIYGNGFQIKPVADLPDAWKSLFFSEEEYLIANQIVKDIFDHEDIKWPQTENKFKMFASAFQQLQKHVANKN